MDLYRPICRNIVTPLWAAWERSPYLKILDQLMESQYESSEEIGSRQTRALQAVVKHAYENTEHYRNSFDEHGVGPADIRDLDDLYRLPTVTKQTARDHSAAMAAGNVPIYQRYFTSGSTGKPLAGFLDKYTSEFKRACAIRSMRWAGFEIGDRIWCMYGNPYEEMSGWSALRSRIRTRLLNRTRYIDLLRVKESDLQRFADLSRREQPSLIWGHTHGLYLLASYLLGKGIDTVRPAAAISAGMAVHQFERERIEAALGCPLLNRYGCEELGLLACECRERQGLHVNVESVILECVDDDGQPVAPGRQGNVVVTDLHNRAMPLIRYRLEDVVVMSDTACPCGRSQPLIESITGRAADFLIATDGALVSGVSLTDHFMLGISGLGQIQIVQDDRDHLVINVVKDATYSDATLVEIAKSVAHFLGSDMKYDVVFLDEIPCEESGKYRFTICKVDHDLV